MRTAWILLLTLGTALGTVGALRGPGGAVADPPAPRIQAAGPDEDLPEEPSAPSTLPEGGWRLEQRFVAAATGRPVAGATVQLFTEVPHPVPGLGTPSATAVSDAAGWVRLARSALDPERTRVYGEPTWIYVEAPGFAPDAAMQPPEGDWALVPAGAAHVALSDPLDRPVEGALVTWLLGCGHTPDVRQVLTGPDGVARFEGVSTETAFQIWFVKDGLLSRYLSDEATRASEPPGVARLAWARTVEGTVLRHDGTPAPGVAVGRPDCHRGPWTFTDAQGRFRLVGSDAGPGDEVHIETGEFPVSERMPGPALYARVPEPGLPLVARLPAPKPADGSPTEDVTEEPAAPEEPEDVRLVVEAGVEQAPEGVPLAIEVTARRLSDGWTADGAVGPQGVALLDVRPGSYRVEAVGRGPEEAPPFGRVNAEVAVPPAGGAYLRLRLPAPAAVEIERLGEAEVALLTEGEEPAQLHDFSELDRMVVLVDPRRPPRVAAAEGELYRVLALDAAALAPGEVAKDRVLAGFPRTDLALRLVDADGRPARGWVTLYAAHAEGPPEEGASEAPTVRVPADVPLRLVVWPADRAQASPLLLAHAPVGRSARPVDGGAVCLPPPRPGARVLREDGALAEHAEAWVTQGARSEQAPAEGARLEDPWAQPGLLVPGAQVRVTSWAPVERSGMDVIDLPYDAVLTGPGPWTLAPPPGALEVDLGGGANAPPERWVLMLDGASHTADQPRARLVGLAPGAHEALIRAPGRLTKRLRFVLEDGATLRWTPRLSPR